MGFTKKKTKIAEPDLSKQSIKTQDVEHAYVSRTTTLDTKFIEEAIREKAAREGVVIAQDAHLRWAAKTWSMYGTTSQNVDDPTVLVSWKDPLPVRDGAK